MTRRTAAGALLTACLVVAPFDASLATELPASLVVGWESLRLPGRERLGLLSIQYLFDAAPGWRVGPAAFGAVSGRRGGLFVWGLEGQRHWPIDERWSVGAGLFVGGGGGAAAPVGSGLMLRPHVDVWRRFDGWSAGVSAAHVRFPSGSIESTQLGLWVAIDQRFIARQREPGRAQSTGHSGFGFAEAALYAGSHRWQRGAQGDTQYVGLRLMRPVWATSAYRASAGVEVAGAVSGSADGYAESFVVAALHTPVAGAELGARAGIGLAGGGGVPTGGGAMLKLGVNLRARFGPRSFVELEHGRMRRPSGSLDAAFTSIAVGLQFAPLLPSEQADALMGASLQSYLRAQRKDGSVRPLSMIGFRVERSIDSATFVSGNAHTATGGGAGAFGVGLVGLGRRGALNNEWSLGGELMVGAAGGGGVAVHGGAVSQAMLWARRRLAERHHLQLSAGRIQAFKGGLASPVVEAGLTMEF